MRSFKSAVAAVLVAGFLVATFAPALAVGGQTGSISGRVVDASGAPVAQAKVVLKSPSGAYSGTTDGQGRFSFIGVVVDTYVLSITKEGLAPLSRAGITVAGDQSTDLGNLPITKDLKTITSVRAAAPGSSAFSPSQTQDSFTLSAGALKEAGGKTFNTNQTELITAAPGTQQDAYGNLTIRGSLTSEVGLNLDGVDYTSVDHGGAVQTFINGIGSISVNPGAGDATQGNTGAGVVNLVPKRGTYPAFGSLDAEIGSGYFNHQLGVEYGTALKNGRLSEYLSFTGLRADTPYGPWGQSLAQAGPNLGQAANNPTDYLNTQSGYIINNDFLSNTVFRFGKSNHESLQVLYQTHFGRTNFDVGGYAGYPYYLYNPTFGYGGAYVVNDPAAPPALAGADLLNLAGPGYPGQTSPTQNAPGPASTNSVVQFLKFEYDNNFNPTTYLAARYYIVSQQAVTQDYSGSGSGFGSSSSSALDGGRRGGVNLELTKQLGVKNTVTLFGKYEIARPVFSAADPYFGWASLDASSGLGLVGRNDWPDFLSPVNKNAPLTFPTERANPDGTYTVLQHGSNDCPSSYVVAQGTSPGVNSVNPYVGGCWLYYLNTTPTINGQKNPYYHYWPGGVPRVPVNYLVSPFNPIQFWSIAVRDQWVVNAKLRIDAGLRYDAANNHLPDGLETGNIGPDNYTQVPRILEPRLAAAYQIGARDSVRASYGRSVVFQGAGTLFTPLNFNYYLQSYPTGAVSLPGQNIPHTDFATNPLPNVAAGGHGCGSGEFGYPIPYRACTSYADLIRWEQDYFAPDNGNAKPTTYNNFDLSYSHLFANGYAVRITPFYKQGYNVGFFGLASFTVDPTTGAIIPQSFRPEFNGVSKQTGLEFLLTTPQRPVGWSGFLSGTYVNSIANRPPGVAGEDSQPLVPFEALQAGNLYRSGYLSPVVLRTGFQYQSKSGIRVNPTFAFDSGYPIGSGLLTPVVINGVGTNVPSTNNSSSLPVQNQTPAISTGYVDPSNPGTIFHPNIYATRGTSETASPGGVLSPARLGMNLSVEYSPPRSHSTFGVQAINVFDQYFSEPYLNQRWQPVATGVPGPLTGQVAGTLTAPPVVGIANYNTHQYGYQPYNLFPSNPPLTLTVYYQYSL